jgi:hypothetical protein
MDKSARIVQVNPLHTKRLKEVNDNSPGKTDDKDPGVVADIIKLGRALSVVIPEGDAAYLRRLNNAKKRHIGERNANLKRTPLGKDVKYPGVNRTKSGYFEPAFRFYPGPPR